MLTVRLNGAFPALLVASVPLPLPALAQALVDGPDYWHRGWGWSHMMFGSLMMILFWGGIALAIVLAARWLGSTSAPGRQPPAVHRTPLDILQERFARGEIGKAEHEERKRLLSD